MVSLPALKFVFLAVRQVSKPLVKATVARAQKKGAVTRAFCVGLGRFSLGILGVTAKWTDENKTPAAAGPQAPPSRSPATRGEAEAEGLPVVPRSRSLLHAAAGGKTAGATQRVGRLFFARRPVQSAWQTFRLAYASAVDEEHLVKVGAEVFSEMLLYSILATILYLELRYASKASEAKERNLLRRIDALEQKVNELIQDHHGDTVDVLTAPEPVSVGRLDQLTQGVSNAYRWIREKW